MSIQGIGIVPGGIPPAPEHARENEARPGARPHEMGPAPGAERESRRPEVGGAAGLPKEPPPGTDPALWQVLTSEERTFYAQLKTRGPLTYAPGPQPVPAEALGRGGRIDFTV